MKLIDLSHPQEFGMPVYPVAEARFAGLPRNICGPGGPPVPAVAKVPCQPRCDGDLSVWVWPCFSCPAGTAFSGSHNPAAVPFVKLLSSRSHRLVTDHTFF
jgi:hypothetical protein